MKPTGQQFRLTVRDLGGSPPAAIRLRQLLKSLLRAWRFKCELIETLEPAGPQGDDNQTTVGKLNVSDMKA